MSKLQVAVLMGGPDAERDVSLQSGKAVANALRDSGDFVVEEYIIDIPTSEEIKNIDCDVIFPVLHGPFGEGGPLQLLLERCGKKFVGSGSTAATNAMDKEKTKEIALALGIKTPPWCRVSKNTKCTIKPPVVIKPINDGSSLGIVICNTQPEVDIAIQTLLQDRDVILAESYVCGRELTVGIVNGVALPIIEIIPPSDLVTYDYEAKYNRDDTQYIVNPDLPSNSCVESAISLFNTMEIRDIARVDFIQDNSQTWLLEVNTMPGFTDHSLVPMAALQAGVPMPSLCSALVLSAENR